MNDMINMNDMIHYIISFKFSTKKSNKSTKCV